MQHGKTVSNLLKVTNLYQGRPKLNGGPDNRNRVIDDAKRLPQAQHTVQVPSTKTGYLTSMQCEQIGTACVILGGGRERKEDAVDPAVGIVLHKKVGDRVAAGETIATIYYNGEAKAERARQLIEESCVVTDGPPKVKRPLIHGVIGK